MVKVWYLTELSRVKKRTADGVEQKFTYDSAGNLLNNGCKYDDYNKLTSQSGFDIHYDADGNMLCADLDGQLTAFAYDSSNRLISAGGCEYTYNAEDVRIKSKCCDKETFYVYDTNAKLSKLLVKKTNGVYTKYVYGNGLISEAICDCELKIYHFDYRGSTVAITDYWGNVTDRFKYDTYGKVTQHIGYSDIIFTYNGRDGVITEPNGLYYMRARYYSPDLMRFINADIVSGSISNAITLNRYAYANGNPVSNVDPFGLSAERGNLGPTPLEAAYMAQHIYSGNIDDIIEGWTLDDILIDENGFRIGVYKRLATNGTIEYTIVNKGTSTMDDWLDNLKQPFGLSKDMKTSISIVKDFVNEHKNAHITFVGHSKGGAEAAANAVANNKNAIIFNPATVNLQAYDLSVDNYDADMTAYIVEGEILNKIFGSVSKKIDDIEIIGKDNFAKRLFKLTTPGMIYDWYEAYKDHGMSRVISSMIADGYK